MYKARLELRHAWATLKLCHRSRARGGIGSTQPTTFLWATSPQPRLPGLNCTWLWAQARSKEANRVVSKSCELSGFKAGSRSDKTCIHHSAPASPRAQMPDGRKAEANKTDQLECAHPISQPDMLQTPMYSGQLRVTIGYCKRLTWLNVLDTFTHSRFCICAHRHMQSSRALHTFRSAR